MMKTIYPVVGIVLAGCFGAGVYAQDVDVLEGCPANAVAFELAKQGFADGKQKGAKALPECKVYLSSYYEGIRQRFAQDLQLNVIKRDPVTGRPMVPEAVAGAGQ